jgi:Uncharacterized protein conserved in bacteria
MTAGRAFRSDLLKLKGKGLWLLAAAGPVGLIAMQALNYGLRFDYMQKRYAGNAWGGLLDNIAVFVPIALLMGITILCSLLANIEHHTSAWKQLLALPVPRTAVFAAKFAVAVMLLAVSCALLSLGAAALGFIFGFGAGDMPGAEIAKLGLYPFLASMPILALLLWLCMTFRNQAVPITIGVVMAVLSIFGMSEWLPVNWPLFAYTAPQREWFLGAGVIGGAAVLALGALHFNRKDVN